mgnify:CR=1 FL=1
MGGSKKTAKIIIIVLAGLMVLAGIFMVGRLVGSGVRNRGVSEEERFHEGLKMGVESSAADLPRMVDEITRMDSAEVTGKNEVTVMFTIIDFPDNVDMDIFARTMETQLVENMRSHPQYEIYKDTGVTAKYIYRDSDGKVLLTIELTPEKYAN